MDDLDQHDLNKLKELLRHTGDFIAYFELAESKMIAWQQEIAFQSQTNEQRNLLQLQRLHNEFEALQEILTQTGLTQLKTCLEKTTRTLLADFSAIKEDYQEFINNSLNQIDKHAVEAITNVHNQLKSYDVEHFRRVANESCETVEKVATHTIKKSSSLLRSFQSRSICLALAATCFATLITGMYISNEMPWEIHQHAKNERQAGRALIQAWPLLSEEIKNTILTPSTKQAS